jgi:type VI secretion system protein VasG
MTVKDIPRLLEKLNDYSQNTLATAVGVCVSRGHYEVRWEHLLLEYIDRNDGDIPCIMRQFGVDLSHLKKAVTRELETLRTGNTGKPLFSPPLLDIIEFAWTLASLDFGLPSISSGTLFVAAFERGQLAMSSYGNLLVAINRETLKRDFHAITKSSVEQTGQTGKADAGGGITQDGTSEVLEQFCTNFTRQAGK